MAHPAARQCLLRLCHIPQASSRTRLSFSTKSLNQSLPTTGNPNPYVCLFSSHTLDSRRRPPSSPSGRSCFSAPPRSPARPRQSGSCFRVRAPSYSTSAPPPLTSPESLSVEQYHELADSYIDWLLEHFQELQQERADVDCEYSVGSLPSPPLSPTTISHNQNSPSIPISHLGRRLDPRIPARRHLCAEQTAAQQADLALVPYQRAETVRLRAPARRNLRLGLFARWKFVDGAAG